MSDSETVPTDKSDIKSMDDEVDTRNSHPIRLSKSHNLTKQSSKINHSKSEELLHETKYVMLNFMSLIPPRLYKDHVHPSPDVTKSSSGYKFSKSLSSLGKSKSVDIAGLKSQKQSRLSKLYMLEREVSSPASEDNVSYRYKQNQTGLDESKFVPCAAKSDTDNHQDGSTEVSKSQSAQSLDEVSSSETSPRKTPRSIYRMISDTSSCGDYSYFSDADDEYEMSHSSSMVSAASLNRQDVFLDLRKSSSSKHLVAHSISQHDDVDAGKYLNSEVIPECGNEENNASDGNLKEDNSNELDEADGLIRCMPGRQVGDRTKLKLNIPAQPVVLDDVLLSLQSELNSEISEMESEFEEVNSVRETAQPTMTPTQAAKILARIGDEVKDEYSQQISMTVTRLLIHKVSELTYQQFKDISTDMIDKRLPGWRQVALLMVYGQSAAWYALQGGHKNIGNIINHCSQFVFDVAAEFIIKEGGWGAVMNFDPSQSSDTQSSAESPMVEYQYFSQSKTLQSVSETATHIAGDSKNSEIPENVDNNMYVDNSTFHFSDQRVPMLRLDRNSISEAEIAQEIRKNDSSKFLTTQMSQTYKPSLGFDFRSQSSVTDDCFKHDLNSNDTLDFVMNGDNSGLFDDDLKTFDSESIEGEVFQDQSANFAETTMTDGTEVDMLDGDLETGNMNSDTGRFDGSSASQNLVSQTNDHQEIGQQAALNVNGEKNMDNNVVPVSSTDTTSLDKKENDELKSDNENETQEIEEQSATKTDGSNTIVQNNVTREISDENQSNGDNEKKCVSFTGYLGGTGTKVMLLLGAAAAMGLGLKFGVFNRY